MIAKAPRSGRRAKKKRSKGGDEAVIPDKLFFRIGEVARLCRLPAYVLRFWETEFPQLKPVKSGSGQRMYRRNDVESVLRIKYLLYEEGFTIPGARQHLSVEKKKGSQPALPFSKPLSDDGIKRLRHGLKEILGILSSAKRG